MNEKYKNSDYFMEILLLFVTIYTIIIICISIFKIGESTNKIITKNIKIVNTETKFSSVNKGEFYQHYRYYDKKDPFCKIEYDTIKIADIKDGYVKYFFIIDGKLSKKYFSRPISDIEQDENYKKIK